MGWLARTWGRRSNRRAGTGSSWERTRTPPMVTVLDRRRRLSQVPYLLPKDVLEHNRLDFQHYLLRSVLHGDYMAPVRPDSSAILDVGCGTGRWVIEMARAFPGAQVIGLDIEPPAQTAQSISPNARYVQANLLEGLPFADRSFDMVHQRLLGLAIPAAYWPVVAKELVRVTRPGGSVELLEGGDVFLNAGPALQRFLSWWREASRAKGFDSALMTQLESLLRAQHLRYLSSRTLEVPVGKWGERSGELLEKNMLAGFPGLKTLVCTQLGLAPQEFDATLAELAGEGDRYHTRYQYYLVYAQR